MATSDHDQTSRLRLFEHCTRLDERLRWRYGISPLECLSNFCTRRAMLRDAAELTDAELTRRIVRRVLDELKKEKRYQSRFRSLDQLDALDPEEE